MIEDLKLEMLICFNSPGALLLLDFKADFWLVFDRFIVYVVVSSPFPQ
jgi:hypothetical protein